MKRRTLLLIVITQLSAISACFSQFNPMICLTRYTVCPEHKDFSIQVLPAGNKIISMNLSGPDAKYFKAGKNGSFSFSGKLKKDAKWFDVTVSARTAMGDAKEGFRIVNDQFKHNKVIAHRGAWKNTGTPENSVASLKQAIAIGCEGSEFDVHLSLDSVLYINHDDKINGLLIEASTSSQLSEIKLSNGETLPTLKHFLTEGMSQNKTKLILEIKPSAVSSERGIALTHKVLQMVRDLKAEGWVDYISFDYDICLEIVKLAPFAKVAYLKGDKSPEEVAGDGLSGLDYHFSVFQKNPTWIKDASQRKLSLNAWTVNEEKIMDWLISEKVDFITTNEPEILLNKLK